MMRNLPSNLVIKVLATASGLSLIIGMVLMINTSPAGSQQTYEREAQALLIMGAYFTLLTVFVVIKNIFDINNP
ncbi:MAG: hypothetical protein GC179_09870 [Anaerolineaceae bacterium]|nr:hypothetical protein [Anaerolineaceae bacterium]